MAKKKSKWKKIAKNVGKAAVLAGALYGASKLGKKGKSVADTAASEDANVGINTRPQLPYEDFKFRHKPPAINPNFNLLGAAKGGRIGAKGGGIAKRGMGAAYKRGGRVKSMGIAKRGGGIAKR